MASVDGDCRPEVLVDLEWLLHEAPGLEMSVMGDILIRHPHTWNTSRYYFDPLLLRCPCNYCKYYSQERPQLTTSNIDSRVDNILDKTIFWPRPQTTAAAVGDISADVLSSRGPDPSVGLTHSGTDRRVECGARYVTWTRWWRCRINRSLPPFDSLKIHIFHSEFQITRVFSKQNHAAAAPWLGHTCFRLNVKPSRKIHLAGVTVPCRGCTFNTWKIYIYNLEDFLYNSTYLSTRWTRDSGRGQKYVCQCLQQKCDLQTIVWWAIWQPANKVLVSTVLSY